MTKKKTEQPPQKMERSKSPKNKVIWLYSPHPVVVEKGMWKFLNAGTQIGSTPFHEQLGIPQKTPIIPVMSWTKDRVEYIEALLKEDLPDQAVIVIAGTDSDQENQKIQKLYEGTCFLLTPRERQFYLDTLGYGSMKYKEFKGKREALVEYLGNHFNEITEHNG